MESTFLSQLDKLEKIDRQKRKLTKGLNRGSFEIVGVSFSVKTTFQALIEIMEFETLTSFKLNQCKASAKKITEMLSILNESCHTLQLIDLQIIKTISKAHLALIEKLPLKTLEITNVQIATCQFNTQLQNIKLARVGCCDFISIGNLVSLSINENTIGVEGAMVLAKCLINNRTLRLLDLNDNQLKSAGTKLILEGLRAQKGLKTLMIANNGICTKGAYAVSNFLLSNELLSELHIEDNFISSVGLNAIFQTVSIKNRTLKFLNISGNFVSIEVMHALKSMLEHNDVLKYLTISDLHKFNVQAQCLIAQSFHSNVALRQVDLKVSTREFYERIKVAAKITFKVQTYVPCHLPKEVAEEPYTIHFPESQPEAQSARVTTRTTQEDYHQLVSHNITQSQQKQVSTEVKNLDLGNQVDQEQEFDAVNTFSPLYNPQIFTNRSEQKNTKRPQPEIKENSTDQKQVKFKKQILQPKNSQKKLELCSKLIPQPSAPQLAQVQRVSLNIKKVSKVSTPKDKSQKIKSIPDKNFKSLVKDTPTYQTKFKNLANPVIQNQRPITFHKKSESPSHHSFSDNRNKQTTLTKNSETSFSLSRSPSPKSRHKQTLSSLKQSSPARRVQFNAQLKSIDPLISSIVSSQTQSTLQESFSLTQNERDMLRYKMQNDKVVGFYKKVLGDIRTVLSSERQNVQKYLK